jgi:hypothetical protein
MAKRIKKVSLEQIANDAGIAITLASDGSVLATSQNPESTLVVEPMYPEAFEDATIVMTVGADGQMVTAEKVDNTNKGHIEKPKRTRKNSYVACYDWSVGKMVWVDFKGEFDELNFKPTNKPQIFAAVRTLAIEGKIDIYMWPQTPEGYPEVKGRIYWRAK